MKNLIIGEWKKDFNDCFGYILTICLIGKQSQICLQCLDDSISDNSRYILTFTSLDIIKIYVKITANNFPIIFSSLKEGQDHVQLFLEKFDRLKVFL